MNLVQSIPHANFIVPALVCALVACFFLKLSKGIIKTVAIIAAIAFIMLYVVPAVMR